MTAITDDLPARLLHEEHAGWKAILEGRGGEHYQRSMTRDALMVVEGAVLGRDEILAAFRSAPPWDSYELHEPAVIRLGDRAGILVYRAVARRGDDYTILDTQGPALSYHPDKLSMERVGDAAFGPEDRIGQLTMRNLDIADSRARLEQYAVQGIVGGATAELVGDLQAGQAAEISAGETETELELATDAANEAAAFDLGTD